MTLAIAWRDAEGHIHLAADSRVSFPNISTDVAIKVAALPYKVIGPTGSGEPLQTIQSSEIGLACAGSPTAMFAIKETIAEILLHLQSADGRPASLQGVSEIIFEVYKRVLPEVTSVLGGKNGVVNLFVVGYCQIQARHEAYLIATNMENQSSCQLILQAEGPQYEVIGSARTHAITSIERTNASSVSDFLNVLQGAIEDEDIPDVGGHALYGRTGMHGFSTFGIDESDASGNVSYWRGALNYNDKVFQAENANNLHVYYPMLINWRRKKSSEMQQ